MEGLSAPAVWPDSLEERVLEGAAKGLPQTVALARELAPVESGTLRDSIGYMGTREGNGVQGTVSASAKHAAYAGYGGAQPAKPFLYPAFKQTRTTVRKAVRQEIQRKMGGG